MVYTCIRSSCSNLLQQRNEILKSNTRVVEAVPVSVVVEKTKYKNYDSRKNAIKSKRLFLNSIPKRRKEVNGLNN